jgi:hypothetical protein
MQVHQLPFPFPFPFPFTQLRVMVRVAQDDSLTLMNSQLALDRTSYSSHQSSSNMRG